MLGRTLANASAAFRVPYFTPFWLSNLLQFVAGQAQAIAFQWLVTDLTTSRTVLGLLGFVQGTTVALASPSAGAAADRFPKRDMLVAGRLGVAATAMVIAILTHLGWIALWQIFGLAVVGGLIAAFIQPASQTYVFDVVGRENVQNAVALNATGTGAAQMIGPALAGALIATVGTVGTFSSAGLGMMAATWFLWRIPIRGASANVSGNSALRDLREGFAWALGHPPVLLALVTCSMALFNGALFAMRPIFARHVLEVGSVGFGMMSGAAGLGTVAGALVASALPPLRRPGIAIALGMFGYSTCLLLYSFAFSYAYVLVVEFAVGVFSQLWGVATFSGLQLAVPEEMRGRVIGMVFMVVQLASIGQLFAGALADRVGDQLALGIFGAAPMLVTGSILVFGHRSLAALKVEPEPGL